MTTPSTTSPGRRRHRRTSAFAALCVTGLLVAACGSDDDSATSTTATETTASTETTGAPETTGATDTTTGDTTGDGGFPVEIENQFGTTVIKSQPERVVSIGYTDGDFILALGVTPVAIRDWYGDQPGGLWPWAQETEAAAAGDIQVLSSEELSVEAIAALDPDVIIGLGSGMTEDQYNQLSQVAPTVAQSDEYVEWGTPWDVAQLTIGRALGLEDEAQALVDDVSGQISDAADAHPEWAGQTAQFGVVGPDGTWYSYTDQDNRGRLLTELGFEIPAEIIDLAGDLFYATGSAEQMGILDSDVLVYTGYTAEDRAALEANALFAAIPAVADGRAYYADAATGGAMSFATTLSLPYALDLLVPGLEKAVAGDGSPTVDNGGIVAGADPDVDAVVEAYETVFSSATSYDEKAAFLPDAEALRTTIEAYATAGAAVGGIELAPTAVTIDGDTATVTYNVLFAGTPVYEDLEGSAAKVDGAWTITRDVFCGFMASARNNCV